MKYLDRLKARDIPKQEPAIRCNNKQKDFDEKRDRWMEMFAKNIKQLQ